VSYVVQQPGKPKGLHDQTLGRGHAARFRAANDGAQARVTDGGPRAQPRASHPAVREAAVLGRWEDPSSALVEADPPHPLQPCRVEQIAFGRLLRRKPRAERPALASAAL